MILIFILTYIYIYIYTRIYLSQYWDHNYEPELVGWIPDSGLEKMQDFFSWKFPPVHVVAGTLAYVFFFWWGHFVGLSSYSLVDGRKTSHISHG